MPTAKEVVLNRVLSMSELSEILRRDFDAMLAHDGLLSSSVMGVGRVAYEIRLTMHLANPANPTHQASMKSKRATNLEVVENPPLAALEAKMPLPVLCLECGFPREAHDAAGAYVDPRNPGMYHQWTPDEAVVHAVERARDIESPNLARIQHQMPIRVETRGIDGRVEQKEVIYPKEIAEGEGTPPTDTDVSEAAKKEMGI